jgi:hypothetical protein
MEPVLAEAFENDYFFWFFAALCSAFLLYGTTGLVCSDLGTVPFVYIFPLFLFLLSHVLAFSEKKIYSHRLNTAIAVSVLPFFAMAAVLGLRGGFMLRFIFFNVSFFIFCLVIHEHLYRKRPENQKLSSFYLTVSSGGFAGGIFCSVIAPVIFKVNYELKIGLIIFILLIIREFYLLIPRRLLGKNKTRRALWFVSGLIPVILIFVAALYNNADDLKTIFFRNHYGTKKVVTLYQKKEGAPEKPFARLLFCNKIIHGIEFIENKKTLTSYYGPGTGIDFAFKFLRQASKPLNVTVMGLGAGVLALYSKDKDYFQYFEIDPQIIKAARENFSFIKDSAAVNMIYQMDARLGFERVMNLSEYELIIMDAFTGGAVPVHLLTLQAFESYLAGLADKGIIAVNISNAYLDFKPLVHGVSSRLDKKTLFVSYKTQLDIANENNPGARDSGALFSPDLRLSSEWALIFNDSECYDEFVLKYIKKTDKNGFGPLFKPEYQSKSEYHPGKGKTVFTFPTGKKVVWTDSFSNIFGILK